jgi:hypothetical protein
VAHEEEGLHARFIFRCNLWKLYVMSIVMILIVIDGSCDVIKWPLFLIFHLVLCVLVSDPGLAQIKAQVRHKMVSEHCVALRFVTLGLDKDPLENRTYSYFWVKTLYTCFLVISYLSHSPLFSLCFNSRRRTSVSTPRGTSRSTHPCHQRKQTEEVQKKESMHQ